MKKLIQPIPPLNTYKSWKGNFFAQYVMSNIEISFFMDFKSIYFRPSVYPDCFYSNSLHRSVFPRHTFELLVFWKIIVILQNCICRPRESEPLQKRFHQPQSCDQLSAMVMKINTSTNMHVSFLLKSFQSSIAYCDEYSLWDQKCFNS